MTDNYITDDGMYGWTKPGNNLSDRRTPAPFKEGEDWPSYSPSEQIAARRMADVSRAADKGLVETDPAFLARIGVTDEMIAKARERMAEPIEEVTRRLAAILRLGSREW